MATSRCAYCGDQAENPVSFAWRIPEAAGQECLEGSMPLCVRCSQSWCSQTPGLVPACTGEDEP